MTLPKFDDVISTFSDLDSQGTGYLVTCPVCANTQKSLSIDRAGNGSAQLFCINGCRYQDILNALESLAAPCLPVIEMADTVAVDEPDADVEEPLRAVPVDQSDPPEVVAPIETKHFESLSLLETTVPVEAQADKPVPDLQSAEEHVKGPAKASPLNFPERVFDHLNGPSDEALESARVLLAGIVKQDPDSIRVALGIPPDAFHTPAQREVVRALHALIEKGVEKPELADLLREINQELCSASELVNLADSPPSINPSARGQSVLIDYRERVWRHEMGQLARALPNLGPDESRGELERIIANTDSAHLLWPEPRPLPGELLPVDAFDPELLPRAIRGWIEDIADRMQCPLDYPAVAAIVSFGSLIGRQLAIRPKAHDDWSVIANLFGFIVGQPGSLKTPAVRAVLEPLVRLEALAESQYNAKFAEYLALATIQRERDKAQLKSIRDAIENGQLDTEIKKQFLTSSISPPIRRRYVVNDCTVEKLGEILLGNTNGVLNFRDELAGFMASLEKDGQDCARSFYLEAWDGNGSFIYDRINRGTFSIPAACVSIFGTIQPGPLREYFLTAQRSLLTDDGLLQRFQMVAWPDVVHTGRMVDRKPDEVSIARAYELAQRLSALPVTELGAQCNGTIPYLRFLPEAQVLFNGWHSSLHQRLADLQDNRAFANHISKYRSLIPAIALVTHILDGQSGPVSLAALERAMRWGNYLESHARRVYMSGLSREVDSAKRLLAHIKAGGLGRTFTARELYRKGWSGLTKTYADGAIQTLLDHGYLNERKTTSGRPTTLYSVHPTLRDPNTERAK